MADSEWIKLIVERGNELLKDNRVKKEMFRVMKKYGKKQAEEYVIRLAIWSIQQEV